MFIKRVILKNYKFTERQLFEETLRLTIGAEYEIKYTEKYIYLEIYDFEDSFSKINVVLDVFNNDFSNLKQDEHKIKSSLYEFNSIFIDAF